MILTLGGMMTYMLLGAIWQRFNFKFLHETGIILMIGIAVGYGLHHGGYALELSEALLFEFCLPLILFAEGYNMHPKEFFRKIRFSFSYGFMMVFI